MQGKYERIDKKAESSQGLGFRIGGEPKHSTNDRRSDGKAIDKRLKPSFDCFICNENHFTKDWPKREKLNAIVVGVGDEDITYVNPVCVFSG